MSLLNNQDKAAEEEEEKEEDKTQEEQPEVIEDDLIKTPGMSPLSKISLISTDNAMPTNLPELHNIHVHVQESKTPSRYALGDND